eukprot:SAG22_NODE_1928_length_3293_cov_29.434878_2_plen_318_part_00
MGPMVQQIRVRCDGCGGAGVLIEPADVCPTCQGVKVTTERKVHEVYIDKGMRHKSKITLHGEADEQPDCEPGDIVFHVHELEHERFLRKGDDLITQQVRLWKRTDRLSETDLAKPVGAPPASPCACCLPSDCRLLPLWCCLRLSCLNHAHTHAQVLSLKQALCGCMFVIEALDGRKLLVECPAGGVIKPGLVRCIVSCRALSFCCASTVFPSKTAPFLAVRLSLGGRGLPSPRHAACPGQTGECCVWCEVLSLCCASTRALCGLRQCLSLPSVCLSVRLPACLSVRLPVCLSVSVCVCLSVCLPACLPACLSLGDPV